MERIPKEDYSFPHIKFNERVVSPPPVRRNYRDTIGIVGEFSKGPFIASVGSREEFRALFGENNLPGSIAVQQAMLQGATNFIISRATPVSKPSNASLNLSSTTPEQFDSEIGNVSDPTLLERTIGLELSHSFVSSPYNKYSTPFGAVIQTRPPNGNPPFHDGTSFTLNGKYSIDINVVEYVSYALYEDTSGATPIPRFQSNPLTFDPAKTNLNNASLTTTNTYLLELSGIDPDANSVKIMLKHLKPGLYLNDNSINNYHLTAESYPWIEDGILKVFVTPQVDFTFSANIDYFVDSNSYSGGAYILGFTHRTIRGDDLSSKVFTKNINQGHAFLVLKRSNISSNEISYLEENLVDGGPNTFSKMNTGVKFEIGDVLSSDIPNPDGIYENLQTNFFLNQGASTSIDILNKTVGIGASSDEVETNAFEEGTRGIALLEKLSDQLHLDDDLNAILTDSSIQNFTLPFSLNLTTDFTGREANRVEYQIQRYVSSTVDKANIDDLVYNDDEGASLFGNWISYVGGRDASSTATRTFYDRAGNPILEVASRTRSIEGNNISVSIFPISSGEFRLEVFENSSSTPVEVFSLNNRDIDSSTGYYRAILDSNTVLARFLPIVDNLEITQAVINSLPERLEPPNRFVTDANDLRNPSRASYDQLLNVSLIGGSDELSGDSVGIVEYQEAIDRLENEDISVIALTGYNAAQTEGRGLINYALSQANNSSTFNGLRTVVAAAPPRITKGAAKSIGAFYDDDRLVLVAGWTSFTTSNSLGFNNSSPVGVYAGKLATINPAVGPNAQNSVSGVLSTDLSSRPDILDILTRSGIEALYFDSATNQFKFLNGRTTNKSNSRKWITLRRVSDHIISNLRLNLSYARSLPNTPDLRSKVASSVNAYMETLVSERIILSYIPALVDLSNNTPSDVTSGNLNIRITYTPLLPSDIINVSVVKSLTNLTDSLDI